MNSYYLSREGKQLGPFSETEVRGMLSTGMAFTSDLACIVGDSQWKPLGAFQEFATTASATGDSGISTIIPYKNPHALIGYYCGIFSLIPCVGFIIGIPALILGFIGLKKANETPGSKGKAHAWTAIILGSIAILVWGAVGVLFLIGTANKR